MELVRTDKQPFIAATGFVEAKYYDQEFNLIKFTSRRKYGVPRKAYMDSKGFMEIQNETVKLLQVTTFVTYRSMSGPIIKDIYDDRLLSKGKGSSCNCHIQNENATNYGKD